MLFFRASWSHAAEPAAAPLGHPPPAARASIVVLTIEGTLRPERRAALERVVRTELARRGVTLELSEQRSYPAFKAAMHKKPGVLLAALLEAAEGGWRIYVVHVASGLSMERRLPGGDEADAAALEAVATILDSAVGALNEGAFPGDAQPGTDPPRGTPDTPNDAGQPRDTPDTSNRAEPPRAAPDATAGSDAPRNASGAGSLGVQGGLGVTAAVLGDTLEPGGTASLTLRFAERFGARAATELYLPSRVSTPYGDFRFQRSVFDLRSQLHAAARPLTLLPELGFALEVLRRSGAAPGPGVLAAPAATHVRAGGVLGVRVAYPLSKLVRVELGVHLECYTRALHFLAAGSPPTQIFGLAPLSAAADLGVSVGRP